jgi:hypothetical protein
VLYGILILEARGPLYLYWVLKTCNICREKEYSPRSLSDPVALVYLTPLRRYACVTSLFRQLQNVSEMEHASERGRLEAQGQKLSASVFESGSSPGLAASIMVLEYLMLEAASSQLLDIDPCLSKAPESDPRHLVNCNSSLPSPHLQLSPAAPPSIQQPAAHSWSVSSAPRDWPTACRPKYLSKQLSHVPG